MHTFVSFRFSKELGELQQRNSAIAGDMFATASIPSPASFVGADLTSNVAVAVEETSDEQVTATAL